MDTRLRTGIRTLSSLTPPRHSLDTESDRSTWNVFLLIVSVVGVPGLDGPVSVVVGVLRRLCDVVSTRIVADLELLPVVRVEDGGIPARSISQLVDPGEVLAVDGAGLVAVLAVLPHVAPDGLLGARLVVQARLEIWTERDSKN